MDGTEPTPHDPTDDAEAAEILDDSEHTAGVVQPCKAQARTSLTPARTSLPADILADLVETPHNDINPARSGEVIRHIIGPASRSSHSPHPAAVQEPSRPGHKKTRTSVKFTDAEHPLHAPESHVRAGQPHHASMWHARAGASHTQRAADVPVQAESGQRVGRSDRLEEAVSALRQRVDALEAALLKKQNLEETDDKVDPSEAAEVLEVEKERRERAVARRNQPSVTSKESDERIRVLIEREQDRREVQDKIRKKMECFRHMGLIFDSKEGTRMNLTEDDKQSIDENYLMMKNAKSKLCDCADIKDFLMKAELLIEQDWTAGIQPLPGNLFCLAAIGELILPGTKIFSREGFRTFWKCIGCVFIVLIQIMGPPLIFLSRMPGNIGIHNDHGYQWRCHPFAGTGSLNNTDSLEECPSGKLPSEVHLMDDWAGFGTTKGLGIVFIVTFILNALFIVVEEKHTWRNLYDTFRFLELKNQKFTIKRGKWLVAGAFVNCWVVVWTCLDIFVVVGASQSPQDLLLDALGLLFLYKLDDVGGDLSFVDEGEWPGTDIAWIYSEIVCEEKDFDRDALGKAGLVSLVMYNAAIFFLSIMLVITPIIAAITPFRDIAPDD